MGSSWGSTARSPFQFSLSNRALEQAMRCTTARECATHQWAGSGPRGEWGRGKRACASRSPQSLNCCGRETNWLRAEVGKSVGEVVIVHVALPREWRPKMRVRNTMPQFWQPDGGQSFLLHVRIKSDSFFCSFNLFSKCPASKPDKFTIRNLWRTRP